MFYVNPKAKPLNMKRYLPAIILLIWISNLYAQSPSGIESAEFVIEKERENKLPPAPRSFERINFTPYWIKDSSFKNTPSFQIIELSLPTLAPLQVQTEPQKARISKEEVQSGTLIQGGFGNYGTPLLLLRHAQKVSDELSYHAAFTHRSSTTGPSGDNKSGDAYNQLRIGSRHRLHPSWLVKPSAGFERRGFYFYGYEPTQLESIQRDSIKQYLQRFDLEVDIQSVQLKSPWRIEARPSFYHFNDRFNAREQTFHLPLKMQYQKIRLWQAGLDVEWLYNRRTDSSRINRSLLQWRPYFQWQNEQWYLQAAARITLDNDSTLSSSLHIYPDVAMAYHFLVDFTAKVGVRGRMQANTLYGLTQQNPWLAPEIQLLHTHIPMEVYAGLQITPSPAWRFEPLVSVSWQQYRPFFVNSSLDSARFVVRYNTEMMQQSEVSLQAEYNNGRGFYWKLQGSLWRYALNNKETLLTEAYHLPTWAVNSRLSWLPLPKWEVQMQGQWMGGIRALRPDGSTTTLQALFDMGLYSRYQFNEHLGAFIQASNILGQSYSRYLYYPSRKITFIGGLSYRF
jgi:hypothetical protein